MPSVCARRLMGLAVTAALAASPSIAGEIVLEWDAVQGATGYRVYHGDAPGQYTDSVDVGNVTTTTIANLPDCTERHLAVKAYNSVGESADFSNVISGWPRPELVAPQPVAQQQGSQFTLDIRGTNFRSGATVQIDNPNVFFDSQTVLSCDTIQVAATVEPTARGVQPAEIGAWAVTVVNPTDVFGTRANAFQVQIDPERFDLDRREGPSRGRLDGRDTIWLSHLFASQLGDANYHPDSDFNGDGWVDGEDLAYLVSNLGRCWNGVNWSISACPVAMQ